MSQPQPPFEYEMNGSKSPVVRDDGFAEMQGLPDQRGVTSTYQGNIVHLDDIEANWGSAPRPAWFRAAD